MELAHAPPPWRPGLTSPWRVAEVHAHRLFLEPAGPSDRGGAEAKPKRMEAHAEDCVLVPPDAEAGLKPLKSPLSSLKILLIKLQVWVSTSQGRRSGLSSSFSAGARIMFFVSETGLPFLGLALVAWCAVWARSLSG